MRMNPKTFYSKTVAAIGTMLLLLAGCAEERATAPSPPEPLHAMNLNDAIVLDVSEWVAADSTDSKDSFHVSFANIPMIQEGRADDIEMWFWGRDCPTTFDLELYLPGSDEWRQVEYHRRPAGIGCCCLQTSWLYARTLSGLGFPELSAIVGVTSSITLRGKDIFDLYARAVEYEPSYESVPIGMASPYHASALAFDGTNLWVSEWYADSEGQPIDSLFILDVSGQRLRAFDISPNRIITMCRDGRGDIWAYVRSGARRIARLDENAILRESFSIEGAVRSEITWWDDRIWYLSGEFGTKTILGIDVAASIESGEAVIDRRFVVDFMDLHFTGLFIEDNTLYGIPHRGSELWRFSFLGDVLETWPMTLGSPALSGARDSNSMWLLYRDPPGRPSGPTLLARVQLPLSGP